MNPRKNIYIQNNIIYKREHSTYWKFDDLFHKAKTKLRNLFLL